LHTTLFYAPSVFLPESFAPSAEINLFPECYALTVLLPESFRGGCSFGAKYELLVSPDIKFLL